MANIDYQLVIAIRQGNMNEVNRCLNAGADPNFVINPYDLKDYVSKTVSWLVLFGPLTNLYTLLFADSKDLDIAKEDTVLHYAIRRLDYPEGNEEIVRVLLARRADPNRRNDYFEKPIHLLSERYANYVELKAMLENPNYASLSSCRR